MWHEDRNYKNNERGQVAIIAIIVVTLIMITVVFSISFISVTDYQIAGVGNDSVQAFFLAESGMEDALMHLRRDLDYSGGTYNPSDMGTYVITVNKSGFDFDIRSEGHVGDSTRVITTSITINVPEERVTKYAAFGGDDVYMKWWTAIVEGDVWANDDINILNDSKIYGNVISAGRGWFFTSWVTWDAEILDNPNTADIVEGNIWSVNTLKVIGGGHISGDAYSERSIWTGNWFTGKGFIDGNEYEWQDLSAMTERIEIPLFEYDVYKTQAQGDGTYFATAGQFEAYVNSLDSGGTRTLPDGVYYVETGDVEFSGGSKIVLYGTIVTKGALKLNCEAEIYARNDLPALVAQEKVEFLTGGSVTIEGVVYSENLITLGQRWSDKNMLITGAVWSGDELQIVRGPRIVYDPSVMSTVGFGFSTATDNIDLHSWQEAL